MITSGLEDYLELIYNSILQKKEVKAVDIANAFNISRSSVSEALIRLADMDLIIYEGRKGISITPKGIDEAKRIVNTHQVLAKFFVDVLGVDEQIAEKNACKVEHVIDKELVDKISEFTIFYEKSGIEETHAK